MLNAFKGYTYQKSVTAFFVFLMDAERQITSVQYEADVEHQFDDVVVTTEERQYCCQVKDFDWVSASDVSYDGESLLVRGKELSLSRERNVLFFRSISIEPSTTFFGLPAAEIADVTIVSISRENLFRNCLSMYGANGSRFPQIQQFFEKSLDDQINPLERGMLPAIPLYYNGLHEETIALGRAGIEVEGLVVIEGKPGVGKSHFAKELADEIPNSLLYRFYTSKQDPYQRERLLFHNFLEDVSRRLYGDFKRYGPDMIVGELARKDVALILDGLDHVENYEEGELAAFVEFLASLASSGKAVVLTRPLKKHLTWKKLPLLDWTAEQTLQVLNELYHITDASVRWKIWKQTGGYPLLVRYIAEHFKLRNELPEYDSISGLDGYYKLLLQPVAIVQSLALFVINQGFWTEDEIAEHLDENHAQMVLGFVRTYPFLFNIQYHRVALFHDSLVLYLRSHGVTSEKLAVRTKSRVLESILAGDSKYLSRFEQFQFGEHEIEQVLHRYCRMDSFRSLVSKSIDFEAIQEFYKSARSELRRIAPRSLSVQEIYDLALILNIVERDHMSTLNAFLYHVVKALQRAGYSMSSVTSSGYMFAMFAYVEKDDASVLYRRTASDGYGVEGFYSKLEAELEDEESFFSSYDVPIHKDVDKVIRSLESFVDRMESIEYILASTYFHGVTDESLRVFHECLQDYLGSQEHSQATITKIAMEYEIPRAYWNTILPNAKVRIEASGGLGTDNRYLGMTLHAFIKQRAHLGSFAIWPEIMNYLRLNEHLGQRVDIESLTEFQSLYYQRKDYSAVNIYNALLAYESVGIFSTAESVGIINRFQQMSEKGIRHILNSYLAEKTPNVVPELEALGDIGELKVEWLDLPAEHIEKFSDDLLRTVMSDLFRSMYRLGYVKYEEIREVLKTTHRDKVVNYVNRAGACVKVPEKELACACMPDGLRVCDDQAGSNEAREDLKNARNSDDNFSRGILMLEDLELVRAKGLSVVEVAGYIDGWFSLLAEMDLLKSFPDEEIRENLIEILHSAIIGRIRSIDQFGYVFHFVGNVPALLLHIGDIAGVKSTVDSFRQFVSISTMMDLGGNTTGGWLGRLVSRWIAALKRSPCPITKK